MLRHVLVTGAAGFIGMHTCIELLKKGVRVSGLDNLIDYYDVTLKHNRISNILQFASPGQFSFHQLDLADYDALKASFIDCAKPDRPQIIVHLGAQAGVRYSVENPRAYAQANLVGTTNILELARYLEAQHVVYASSSSVYGGNTKVPFSEDDRVDNPVSFYAATKRANEAMAYSYSKLFSIPLTGLRFFTVYGPWGRPDMAPWMFTAAAFNEKTISIFGQGLLQRDFTYIDDIVQGVISILQLPSTESVPHRILNIGNSAPNTVNELVAAIELSTGRVLAKEFKAMPLGDVPATFADVSKLQALTGFQPRTALRDGIAQFVNWYRDYHKIP